MDVLIAGPKQWLGWVALLLVAITLAVGIIAGQAAPLLWVPVVAVCGFFVIMVLVREYPDIMLGVVPVLLFLASTKFRVRDPRESLSGTVDWQILLELGLVALVGLIAVGSLTCRRPRLQIGASGILLGGYCLLAMASAAWSVAPLLTVVRGSEVTIMLVAAYAGSQVRGPVRALEGVVSGCLASVMVCAGAQALLPRSPYSASQTGLAMMEGERFTWFAVHPIDAATLAAVAVLGVLAEGLHATGGWRRRHFGVPLWILAPVLFGVVLLTRSRGPLGALVVVSCGMWVGRRSAKAMWALFSCMAIAALLLYAVGSSPSEALEGLVRGAPVMADWLMRGQSMADIADVSGRRDLWREIVGVIANSPWYGHGYQASRALFLDIAKWAAYAHNAILQTISDLGIFGALLLWPPLLAVLLPPRGVVAGQDERLRAHRAVVVGIAGFLLISALTDESFAAGPTFLTFLVFHLIVAASWYRASMPLQAHPGDAHYYRHRTAKPPGAAVASSSHRDGIENMPCP